MTKKVGLGIGILALLALVWYLFVKPYDYTVRFTVNTFPGAINQSVKLWHESDLKQPSTITNEVINAFTQTIKATDSTFIYDWKITPITDSTSKVKVRIKDVDRSFANKLAIPFSDTPFEKGARQRLLSFNKLLSSHIKSFKVTVEEGEHELPSTFYAYIPVECDQLDKAGGMMRNFNYLSGTLVENDVEINGLPFNYITKWDMENDSIHYRFCYPILRSDRLPKNEDISYKRLFPKKALKAVYNGNYLTSDRAWYVLRSYAKKNNIEVELTPIEVFHNNPNMGGNELEWKTEVYLPIKEHLDD